ncbi:MAG: DinB family protein [Rhodovibrionaceae bacterium]
MSAADPALGLLRSLAQNNAWANHVLHRACAKLGEEDYLAARASFFPSIALTLNHICEVDGYYLSALEGIEVRYANRDQDLLFASFAELSAAQKREDRRFVAICNALTTADLQRKVRFVRPGDVVFDEPLTDVIAHLAQHQVHHRGQVHAMLSETPVAPPQLDDFFLGYGVDPLALRYRAGEWPQD